MSQLSEKDRLLLNYLYWELEQMKKTGEDIDENYVKRVGTFLGFSDDESVTTEKICRVLGELKVEQANVHNELALLETRVEADVNKITQIYGLLYDSLGGKETFLPEKI